MSGDTRWQPVVMVLDRRLECECGALAVFVNGKVKDDKYNALENVDVWCQDCWQKAIDEGNYNNTKKAD